MVHRDAAVNYHAVKPTFTIVDAIMAMEKHGPSGGIPKQVSLIFGGIDCIAMDRVIAEVINAQPSQSPLLRTAKAHNIGEQNLNNITILGESLSSAKIPDFILPKLVPIGFTTFRVMKSLAKHLWLKNFGKAVLFLLTLSPFITNECLFRFGSKQINKFSITGSH